MATAARCSSCGADITAGARFCMRCGADVSGEQAGVATSLAPARPGSPKATATQAVQAGLLDALRDATLGEYEILAELGRGGMATVFLAHDIQLDRKVAIKVMSPQLVAGEGMVDRFKLEARTAAGLSHPHIIPIYAVRQTNDLLYFVMKFIEGRPLDSIIKQSAPLPVPMVRSIVTRVGEALGYAHRRGVVHRDIKPANIMIDVEGMPIVTDFGIAKVADKHGLTMTGATIGTPTYMSPEQCNAQPITGASDQYSLGVMAYEMLTGRPLYDGDSVMTIMFKHVHDEPPSVEALGPGVPRDLAEAVTRMLRKNPAERWPTIEEALPFVAGSNLAYDDSVRTQMVQFARAGSQRAILDRVSTPRSPIPVGAHQTPIESAETVRVSSGMQQPTRRQPAQRSATRAAPAPRRSRAGLAGGLLALLVLGGGGAMLALKPWATPASDSAATDQAAGQAEGPVVPPVTPAGGSGDSLPPARPADPPPAAAPVAAPVAASVAITRSPDRLAVGESFELAAAARDQDDRVVTRPVRWVSSNPRVAEVSRDGRLVARAEGTTTVTAEADGRRQSVTVVVSAIPVARVEITPASGTVEVNGRLALTAAAVAASGARLADRPFTWRSSNPEVAQVSSDGTVVGMGPGTATITAAGDGASGAAQIQVRAPAPVSAPPPTPANSTATAPAPAPAVVIAQLVEAYAAALQGKDIARARALYPEMSAQQARETQAALDAMQNLQVQLQASNITVSGGRAQARVTGQWRYNRGERLAYNQIYDFELRAEGWRIIAIR